jgi:glycosyltransferase involved in cell wall biosynthesis
VVAVINHLALGGVARVYVELFRTLSRRGVRCVLVCGPGPLAGQAEAAGIEVVEVDWSRPRTQTYDQVARAAEDATLAYLVADPALVHVLPALTARSGRVVLALHTSAPRLRMWFEEQELARLVELARTLVATGRLRVQTIGARYAAEYEPLFGGPVGVLRPAVRTAVIPFAPPARLGVTSILCLGRLAPEKLPHVHAATALTSELLSRGRRVHLTMVGDGPGRAATEDLCRAALPDDAWSAPGATSDPLGAIRAADVVLGTGLVALEAVSLGRPVVIVRTTPDDEGALGPVLTPERFDTAAEDSFGWRRHAPRPRHEVVDDLLAFDVAWLADLRARVEREHDVDVVAEDVAADLDRLRAPRSDPALEAVGRVCAAVGDQRAALQQVADEQWSLRAGLDVELTRVRFELAAAVERGHEERLRAGAAEARVQAISYGRLRRLRDAVSRRTTRARTGRSAAP